VPLSEHEQHLLQQMEQALYAEDPKFASQMQGSIARARMRRRILVGVVAVLAGLALVVLGVVNAAVWLGAIGFALMIGGAVYAITPPKTRAPLGAVAADGTVRPSSASGKKRGRPAKSGQTFMQRLEDRWDRRRNDWH
jgi:hypothetical protein